MSALSVFLHLLPNGLRVGAYPEGCAYTLLWAGFILEHDELIPFAHHKHLLTY